MPLDRMLEPSTLENGSIEVQVNRPWLWPDQLLWTALLLRISPASTRKVLEDFFIAASKLAAPEMR